VYLAEGRSVKDDGPRLDQLQKDAYSVVLQKVDAAAIAAVAEILAVCEARGARADEADGTPVEFESGEARAMLGLVRAKIVYNMLTARGLTDELINERRRVIESPTATSTRSN
jgi:hypothetical protein